MSSSNKNSNETRPSPCATDIKRSRNRNLTLAISNPQTCNYEKLKKNKTSCLSNTDILLLYNTYNKILLRRNHAGAMLAGSNLTVRTVLSQMIRLVVSLDSTSITARVMMTEI